ncbi:MAG: fibronectin type III domain-containing protein, partial [Muribaculaceae bacterium]|nr:fibronectin type III domain-containing protein [Muribaculaceae bacterium]
MTEGVHSIKVVAIKDGNSGMESTQRRYFGHDKPNAPGSLTVSGDDASNVVISWNAVTAGVNSGYIDTDAIRYTLKREPGHVILAENIQATEFVDRTIESMNYYTYEVSASDGVKSSDPAISERLLLGESFGVYPPYRYEFGAEGFGVFTEIDANADGYKWAYSEDPAMVWYVVNPSKNSDDWLISPPVNLENGKHYNLNVKLTASSRYETERVEILYGKAPTPESMTKVIAPAKDFVVSGRFDEWIIPEETGLYYIGIHVITEAVEGAMRIDWFDLAAGVGSQSPAAAVNAVAQAGAKGAISATVLFDCPTKTFDGSDLKNITKVVVTNTTTGRVIYTLDNPGVGASLSAPDDQPVEGMNEYTVICSNEHGEGSVAEISCWVGVDLPAVPRNVKWVQLADDRVRLTWDAPAGGEHGGYVDIDNLKYYVVMPESKQVVHESWGYLSMELNPGIELDQDLLSFGVCGVNEKGLGIAARSNQSAFGKAYPAPFYESFEGANIHSTPWLTKQVEGYNPYAILTDIMGLPVTAYDDNGMVVYTPLVA